VAFVLEVVGPSWVHTGGHTCDAFGWVEKLSWSSWGKGDGTEHRRCPVVASTSGCRRDIVAVSHELVGF
jgi:hypothetical protein